MEKYTKVRKIGEGAFGKAILVNKKQNGQQYVVKEINILKMGAKEREEARKEVSVLAQLSHPNIVTYRESFEEHGSLYIVMDFCEKGDLYSKINSQRGLLISEDQIMDWFVQICLAMKHIHDRKILHRDIKSQNIFISGDGRIQLGDFGIAKVLNSTVELARTCIGTPYYLSPEICENRPYNNKSDIWSLGCVLYEMTTLKHAFEAGNMKNLVLKIIRGSYPPIPPKYSYELRGLIAKLFKRTPKDRPSINSVLKQNFVTKRVAKFLSEEQMQSEFSHTVMHGKKINARALPPPPPSSRPPSARKTPLPGAPKPTPKYNPAAVYGAPQVRKSKENRSSVDGPRKRPGSANSAGRPGSANSGGRPGSASQDVKKKKQEMVDRENKRREELKKAAERKHKELIEKQKLARINKAREENWKSMVDSLESDRKNIEKNQPKEQVQWHQARPADNVNRNNLNVGAAKERGKYDQYHAYLDKLQRDRDTRDEPPKPAQPSHAYMAAPRPLPIPAQPVPKWHRPGSGRTPDPTPIYGANPQANRDRRLDAKAAERAKIVDDFIQRKKEAAMNKQRGKMDIFGNPSPEVTPRNDSRPSSARDQPQGQSDRNREEQEYLERLRQIRKQNYNERRGIQLEQQAKREAASQAEAEARKKKIEALRQQADDRAKQLKKQLEEQRKNQYEKEKARINRPVPAPRPVMKPAPAASITAALNAVGVEPKLVPKDAPASPAPGITGALHAIGVESRSSQDTEAREKSVFQQQKDEILRRVNEKSNREKWGGSDKSVGEKDGSPDTARSKWGEDGSKDMLKDVPLEMTASQMDATTNEDQVIKKPELEKGDIAAEVDAAVNRRQWGRPGSTVLKALNQAPIMEGSLTVNSEKSDNRDQEKSSGEVSRSQWGGKRESVLDRLKQAPIINNTISSDKSELIDQEQSEQTGSEEEVKLRRQWGGKRDSLLDRLKAKALLRDSLVSDSERTKQIGSEEEVKLRSQWGGKRFSLLDRLKIKSLQDDSLVPEKEESKQNLSEEDVKLRSHWGGKRESVLERLKAKSLLEDSPDPENEGSEQIRPDEEVRSQWGGKRESVLDRLKAKSLIEDSLVFENEGSQQIACTSEEEVKLRRQWGGKRESVLDRLQAKSLMRDSLVSDESVENKSSPEVTKQPSTAIGTTITIAKTPIQKGTITIQKSNVNSADLLQRPDVSQHISESNQKSESSAHDTETVQLHQDIDSSSQSETVSVTSKPPVPTKPAIPSKPDILPKPVILQKPDEPMNFGDTVPQSVNLKGEGELFNKVKTEEKELEKPRSGVIMGLFTGNFDMGNAKMLRTCSEPDLVRLFKTLESHVEQKPLRKSVDVNQLQGSARMLDNVELDDDSGPEKSPSPTKGDNQEEDDIVDDEDYEDLLSVRETMASLLLRECSTDEESSHHNTGKFSLPSNKDSDIMEEDDNNKDVDDNDNDGNVDDENDEEKAEKADDKEKEVEDGNDDGNDATEAEEYQRNLEEIVDEDGDEEDIDDQDADGEIASPSIEDLFQSDDSDADTQFGDDEEDYDLFSRLEESRAELETELGCDKFLKIYKTVQALQEDEDENMEDGIVIVTKLLGKDKEHLYPKIFQLVMADAAFQEEQSALNENGRS